MLRLGVSAALFACILAGCGGNKQREEGRAQLVGHAAEQIQAATAKAAAFDFDGANAVLRDLRAKVRESPFADVATYDKLTADIEAACRRVSEQDAEYQTRIRHGWKLVGERLVSPEEQKRIADAQQREADDRARQAEDRARQEAEARRRAKEEADRRTRAETEAKEEAEAAKYWDLSVFDAESLYRVYEANEIRADRDCTDKWCVVTGMVTEIGKALFGEPYVCLYAGAESVTSVQCVFPKSASDQLADLSPGDMVGIAGLCRGRTLGQLLFKQCSLLQPSDWRHKEQVRVRRPDSP